MKGLREGKAGYWIAAALAVAALMLAFGQGSPQTSASQEERRIAEVLSAMEGAGKVEVALFYAGGAQAGHTASAPAGAVIVAEGAYDVQVRLSLIRAARTLLGLPEAAVDVFAMEGKSK